MPLISFMQAGKLPEKPWRTEAVGRFLGSVFICWRAGMVVITMVQYFEGPQKTSTALFLACTCGTLACLAGSLVVVMRPWSYEKLLQKLLLFLLFLYGAFFLMWLTGRVAAEKGEPANTTVNVLIAVLAFQGAATVLAYFFVRQHGMSWGEGFGFRNKIAHVLLLGACAGMIVLPVALSLNYLSVLLLELLKFHPEEQAIVISLRGTEGWRDRLVMGVVTILVAPLGEEIVFRGILYPWIKRIGHPQLALWVTALLFAGIHLDVATFVPLAFLAIVLVWLYEHTGNLLACVMTHSIFNAANFIALYTLLAPK